MLKLQPRFGLAEDSRTADSGSKLRALAGILKVGANVGGNLIRLEPILFFPVKCIQICLSQFDKNIANPVKLSFFAPLANYS